MEAADVVLRFLESVGRRSEAEFYLGLFRAEPKEQFAALVVDANVARHATDAVVLHLRFLASLGLFPVVVLGTFDPVDALEHAARIRRKLEKGGAPARLVAPGPDLAVEATAACRSGTLPVVAYGTAEGATPEERFNHLGRLLTDLRTNKLIFLHRPGGLQQAGTLVPLVNVGTDLSRLILSKELSRKERALLEQSRRLLVDLVPHRMTIAVTSPLNLFRELFTTKGAGTLLRRGAVVQRRAGFDDLDVGRLKALITSSFGRPPLEEYFTRPVTRVYLEEAYRGAAIVVGTPLGAYLSKFAVDREAQGEGVGRDLWDVMLADFPVLFWRARPTNGINEWYAKQCDGMLRAGGWVVFWKGLAVERVPEAVAWALTQPVDLPPLPAPESLSSAGG